MNLTGKALSVGEHERDGEVAHGVFVEVSKEQLREHGTAILYQEVEVSTRAAIGLAPAHPQSTTDCPFCGAVRKPHCSFIWFECGTMTAPSDSNRRDQTPACAAGELLRLTRERNEARAVLMDPQALWINILRGTVALPKGIGDVRQWQERVKRLEEALEACAAIIGPPGKSTWATDQQIEQAWQLYLATKET